jgi:hypothetical protein
VAAPVQACYPEGWPGRWRAVDLQGEAVNEAKKKKVEFGDFQTPLPLARLVCARLKGLGIMPELIVEPTCGVGAFVLASAEQFPAAEIHGIEINNTYLDELREGIERFELSHRIRVFQQDFFATDWMAKIESCKGRVMILGNPPWVTSAGQGVIGGKNLPSKSNFLKFKGFDAITGKSNFDISEWMVIDLMRALGTRGSDLAMLVKTAVARKVIAHAERMQLGVSRAAIFGIDAKRHFGASVDACLLVIAFTGERSTAKIDYDVYPSLDENVEPRRVGHRLGLTISDIEIFERHIDLVGDSPQKWRSGVKHDAAAVMEFDSAEGVLRNGLNEDVCLEPEYLYPLMKGSDIGSNHDWRGKFVLITQRRPGDDTEIIRERAPRTWDYLFRHKPTLDSRGSSIYAKNPQFAIFGIGEYAFRPWRIAICGLYKRLNFRLVGPIDGKPVQFDDTVYYISFNTRDEAQSVLKIIRSVPLSELYSALIFWDEKRPIKSSLLNVVDWSRCSGGSEREAA